MASARTGRGDPAKTLQLLWRAPSTATRRGPAPSLSVDLVVETATELADRDGLAAVTIRRVAERIGVSTMSVYTYVPGKPELLDLMLDHIYLAMPRGRWRTKSWRRRMAKVAKDNRDLFARHPWAASIASLTRPPLGPGVLAKYEHELSAFDGTGLDDVQTDAALTFLLGFVQATARAAADAGQTARTGQTAEGDAVWWQASAPLLAQYADEKSYLRAARVGTAAGAAHGAAFHAGHAYEFGLTRILDGLGVLIDSRSGVDSR